MDKPKIRNYFVVAVAWMFCLLNMSAVSAQTATDLNCAGCVGPGEVANNTVECLTLDGAARGFLTVQADDVAISSKPEKESNPKNRIFFRPKLLAAFWARQNVCPLKTPNSQ